MLSALIAFLWNHSTLYHQKRSGCQQPSQRQHNTASLSQHKPKTPQQPLSQDLAKSAMSLKNCHKIPQNTARTSIKSAPPRQTFIARSDNKTTCEPAWLIHDDGHPSLRVSYMTQKRRHARNTIRCKPKNPEHVQAVHMANTSDRRPVPKQLKLDNTW